MLKRVVAIVVVVALLAGGGFLAWRRFGGGVRTLTPPNGGLAFVMRGQFRGRMTFDSAHINWCPVTRVAVLEAIARDTGFAIVLHEADSVTSGPHAVFPPDLGVQFPHGSATAAVRWMRERDTTIVGFRAIGGRVDMSTVGPHVSGSFSLRLRATAGPDSLLLDGRFAGIPMATMAAGCA